MSGTITKMIGRFLVVYGFIVTALTISGIVEISEIKDIQQFANAIFNTNCMLLGNCFFILKVNSSETCSQIFIFGLALLFVAAALLTVFYKTFSMIFASISTIF